jgi:hypothetical protein
VHWLAFTQLTTHPYVHLLSRYLNRVRGAGVKLWLDGSPPTALLSELYNNIQDASDMKYTGVEVCTCICVAVNGHLHHKSAVMGLQLNCIVCRWDFSEPPNKVLGCMQ